MRAHLNSAAPSMRCKPLQDSEDRAVALEQLHQQQTCAANRRLSMILKEHLYGACSTGLSCAAVAAWLCSPLSDAVGEAALKRYPGF